MTRHFTVVWFCP